MLSEFKKNKLPFLASLFQFKFFKIKTMEIFV